MSYSMFLNLHPHLKADLKQNQRLMMMPQMQQALKLLQVPTIELSSIIEAEMEQNPILEYSEENQETSVQEEEIQENEEAPLEAEVFFDENNFDILKRLDEEYRDYFAESGNYSPKRSKEEDNLKTYLENSICAELSLFEFLMQQAQQTFENAEDLILAEAIIGNFDERGFLQTPLSEIALLTNTPIEIVQKMVEQIQHFEPFGVGACNLRESLLIQLMHFGKQHSLSYMIIDQYFEDLLHNRIPVIQKGLKCSFEVIKREIDGVIAKLDLHPGTQYSSKIPQSIVPDVALRQTEEGLYVEINHDSQPFLRLNPRYLRMLEDESLPAETKEFIRHKILSAKWLVRNIDQRNDTIVKIVELLAKVQKDFFLNPDGNLVPLTMKDVAKELNLHESTIARAVSNKYVDTPRGLLPLKSFFSNAYMTAEGHDISSQTVRDVLVDIIKGENKQKPLSDEEISKILIQKGIKCARRTVAKYRRELKLGNALQRKSYF